MPTYEYKCNSCEHEWEENQKISDEAIKICPECDKESAKRLISLNGFVLKGSGWFNSGGY